VPGSGHPKGSHCAGRTRLKTSVLGLKRRLLTFLYIDLGVGVGGGGEDERECRRVNPLILNTKHGLALGDQLFGLHCELEAWVL
jgi:hypothetical protein